MARRKPQPRKVTKLDAFIGQRLRQARIEQNISQQQLGAALGVSFQQIQKYEKGMNRISSARLEEIARAVNRPRSYFFAGSEGERDGMSAEVSAFLTMKTGVKIARNFPKLTPPSQALIVDLVGKLARQELRHD